MKKFKWLVTGLAMSLALTACSSLENMMPPTVPVDYQQNASITSPLEKHYMQNGGFTVASQVFVSGKKAYPNYKIWYPSEMVHSGKQYPLVIMANGTGIPYQKYEQVFEHLASWGFVVAGNNDNSSMLGQSTSDTLDFILALSQNHQSLFFNKINTQQIGVAGHSQGGVGAVSAVVYYPNGHLYKAVFAASGGHGEVGKTNIPYFLVSGTTGIEKVLAKPEEFLKQFNSLNNNGLTVLARRKDTGHGEMLYAANGYMVAWFRYHLQQDSQAGKAFLGLNAEIAKNPLWQDVKIKGQ